MSSIRKAEQESLLLETGLNHDHNEYRNEHDKKSKFHNKNTSKMTSFRSRLREIFPTKWLFVFFVSYTILYIIGAILVRFSSNNSITNGNTTSNTNTKSYSYDTVSVVLLTETLKLILNSIFYIINGGTILSYFRSIIRHRNMALYYLIPSGLYGLYNNLTFVSLSVMDPATYYILLQFRIAVTAIIYQMLFKRDLSRVQWLSLLLLTVGCIIKQCPNSSSITAFSANNLSLIIISIQVSFNFIILIFIFNIFKPLLMFV